MAQDHAFDIVSKVDFQNLRDIVQTAKRTVLNRFDLKQKENQIEFNEKEEKIEVTAISSICANSIIDIFYQCCIKKNVSIKAFKFEDLTPAAKATVKTFAPIKQGIDSDTMRKINTLIKEANCKVKTVNQKDQIRVTSKSINDLQAVIHLLNGNESIEIALQYDNLK